MRCLLTLAMAAVPVFAQTPTVLLKNVTRPDSTDFQVGDRFEIAIIAAANQPVSVRTARMAHTDWGPVIGWTDSSGRWSTTGQFEKSDLGNWFEVWTVRSFVTPSDPDPFRTPDGRLIPGRERSAMTAEQYQAEIMQYSITSHPGDIRTRELGDAAGVLIAKIIGVNALTEEEMRNVLSILHAAFEKRTAFQRRPRTRPQPCSCS